MKHLQSLSYKTLFTILFFSLAGIVFFLKIGGKTTKVSAAWWDDSWHYRKAISITNSSGSNLTDFQVAVSIGTSQLIADGKMQTDCDDIRLTDINGNLLPYWIEENNPGCNQLTDTKIWLKASSLPTSGATVYIYYGNSQAVNNENGNNVFLEFDDFKNSSNINNWTLESNPTTTYSISGGTMSAIASSGDYSSAVFGSNYTDVIVNSRFSVNATQSHGGFIFRGQTNAADNSYQWMLRRIASDNRIQKRLSGGQTYLLGGSAGIALPSTLTAGNWYPVEFRVSGTTIDTYFNNLQAINGDFADTGFSSGKVGILSYDGNEFFDYIFVRKYASTLPIPSVQSEETSGGPIAYWKFDEGIGSTAYDSAGNNNGSISGATYISEDQCVSGKCLNFNGSGSPSVNVPNNNIFNFGNNNFTISAWALNRDYTYPKSNFMIKKSVQCFTSGASNAGFDIGHGYVANGIDICIRDNNNNSVRQNIVFDNGYRPSQLINKWTHYVFVFNRTNGKILIYINGIKQSSEMNISSITGSIDSNYTLSMGTLYGWQTDGMYDEVKIYPYARTADQIKQDYNSRGTLSGSSANLGVQSPTAPDLHSSLIAYYKFDEGQGVIVNNSINGGVGLSGVFGAGSSSPTWVQGKVGKGLSFDGNNDYIRISDNASFDLSDNFTLSSWVYLKNQNSSGIIHKGNSTINGAGLSYGWGGNGFMFISWNGSNSPYDTRKSSDINQWHHLVGVVKNGTRYLYVDGNFTSSSSSAVSSWNNSIDLYFGCSGNVGSFVNGIIDEVKIYNTALTPEEIKQDYNQGSAIQFGQTTQNIGGTTTSLDYCIPGDTSYCAAPIAEWKMDEGVGSSAVDTSGNNNTGTISGATWTQGKIGKSLNFNGTNDYVSIPTYSYTTNTTISVWVKGSYINGSQIIVGSPNSISLGIYNVGSSKGIIGFSGTSKAVGIANNFVNNDWNHLTVVLDSSGNATYYCNGQLLSNSGTNYWIWSSGTYIGRRDSGNYFKGQIDHIKIYDYARTPAQIAYDYNKGGPVGWWKFDECQGSTAYDWSGNANHGTINIGSGGSQNSLGTCAVGTSAAWTNGSSGKINSSLNFDGTDDYINIPDAANNSLDFGTSPMSISFFTKTNVSGYHVFLDKNWGLSTGPGYLVATTYPSGNTLFWYIGNGSNSCNTSSNKIINDNQWHHVVLTLERGTSNDSLKIYIDGKLDQTKSCTAGFNINSSQPINIARGLYSSDNLPGQIDDIRIYNYALTSEQVKNIYNGGAVNFQ